MPLGLWRDRSRHDGKVVVAMRLSLGLEARQVQIQKLAPRMIQSMEILQLPIMALQERIEQEMNENPLLEIQEQDPDAARRTDGTRQPGCAGGLRARVGRGRIRRINVDDFERLFDHGQRGAGDV